MRYQVGGLTIRSENAAKSPKEGSAALVRWIGSNVQVKSALDFGCGRLRYTGYLARASERIAIVDSAEQLERRVRVAKTQKTIREYALEKWPRCQVYSLPEAWAGLGQHFEFILCANVLSAIPSKRIRSRSIRAMRDSLAPRGRALIVNQHRNSDFTNVSKRYDTVRHLDGWLNPTPYGAAYYGILPQQKVLRIVRGHGLHVLESWNEGQSNWVLVTRP